jgi:hypothetical protein
MEKTNQSGFNCRDDSLIAEMAELQPSPTPSFSGHWRVDHPKSDGMDPILALMGVPWLVRRVADQLDVATVISHDINTGDVSTSETTSVGVVSENKMIANGIFVEKKGNDGRFAKVRCSICSPNELLQDVTRRKNEQKEQQEGKEASIDNNMGDKSLEGVAEPGAFTIDECLQFCTNGENNSAEGVMRIVTVLPDQLGVTDNVWVLLKGRARMLQRLAFSRAGQTVRIRRELFNAKAPDAEGLADIIAAEKTASARKKKKNEVQDGGIASRKASIANDDHTDIDDVEINEETHALRQAQSAYSLLVSGSITTKGVKGKDEDAIGSVVDGLDFGNDASSLLRAAIGISGGAIAWSEPEITSTIDPFFVTLSGLWVQLQSTTQSTHPTQVMEVNVNKNSSISRPPLSSSSLPSPSPKSNTRSVDLTVTTTSSTTKTTSTTTGGGGEVLPISRLATVKQLWKASASTSLIPFKLLEVLESSSMSIDHTQTLCILTSPSSTTKMVLPLDGQWRPERVVAGSHLQWVLIRASQVSGAGDKGPAWVGYESLLGVGMIPRVFLSGDEDNGTSTHPPRSHTENGQVSSSSSSTDPLTADPFLPFFSCLDFNPSLYSVGEVLIEVVLADIGHQVQAAAVNAALLSSSSYLTGLKNKTPAVSAAISAGIEPWQALPWIGKVPTMVDRLQVHLNFTSAQNTSVKGSTSSVGGVSLIETIKLLSYPTQSLPVSSESGNKRGEELESKTGDIYITHEATFLKTLSSPALISMKALDEKKRLQFVRAKLLTRRGDADRLRRNYFLAKIDI